MFGRIGVDIGPLNAGVFGLSGRQKSRSDPLATTEGTRDTDKRVAGADLSGTLAHKVYWFVQGLWNNWQGFLDTDPSQNYR